jgi:glyoxylase-like metal-dependent hydrolase (beta-lactamase superfamily II)
MIKFKIELEAKRTLHQYWGKISNLYILVDPRADATYLVDCGMPSDTDDLVKILDAMPPLKRVVCTHFHVDHVSGWINLKKRFKDCEIWFHEKAKSLVEGKTAIPWPDLKAYKNIFIPCMKEYGYVPSLKDAFQGALLGTPFKKGFPDDHIRYFIEDQEALPGFTTIWTPGHRPDETSFFEPVSGIFISGDFIIVIKRRMKVNTFVSSMTEQKSSLEKIEDLQGIRMLCPGHGSCMPFSTLPAI